MKLYPKSKFWVKRAKRTSLQYTRCMETCFRQSLVLYWRLFEWSWHPEAKVCSSTQGWDWSGQSACACSEISRTSCDTCSPDLANHLYWNFLGTHKHALCEEQVAFVSSNIQTKESAYIWRHTTQRHRFDTLVINKILRVGHRHSCANMCCPSAGRCKECFSNVIEIIVQGVQKAYREYLHVLSSTWRFIGSHLQYMNE